MKVIEPQVASLPVSSASNSAVTNAANKVPIPTSLVDRSDIREPPKEEKKGFFSRIFGFGVKKESIPSPLSPPPVIDTLSIKADVGEVLEVERRVELLAVYNRFKSIVEVKDRTWRLRTYRNCFVGEQAVASMLTSGMCADEAQALDLGNRLLKGGFFNHVSKVSVFLFSSLMIVFCMPPSYFLTVVICSGA
jgi:hypothetical protein